ncbi:hypothetical protein [Adhaeretor mobilis]|uniref:Uncharacterized protein n=1 Tax=Adhaeretor mobilis TaxID=1930276 RepID=A0A517MZ55_9BACT|nr:hypothetical protein [Adhaeretor mobilis]QDT00157.1 hypothetical protein HG15A2_34920 [Adhaeretor mobilis]
MRSLLFVVSSFAITILCWGAYGPVLHLGQEQMVTDAGRAAGEHFARLRPFVCVGLAYFVIGVIVPAALLKTKGEKGEWTASGAILSLIAGALGAVGALGIIMAFNFGGTPVFVMPLVFGGAPVVNSFLTIYMAKKLREIGPLFQAGLIMVLLGAVTVLTQAPKKEKPEAEKPAVAAEADAPVAAAETELTDETGSWFSRKVLQILSIVTTVLCWGAYGPLLHKGQAAMGHSRMRPLLCVGVAYFAIAVVVPNLILAVSPEQSHYGNFSGTMWSLAAGAAGAIGALGIILAFNFGGKPVYVMPLVFGGAPVVSTLISTWAAGLAGQISSFFMAGMILVIAGAAITLVFAPRGTPPKQSTAPPAEPDDPIKPAELSAAEASAIEQRSKDAITGGTRTGENGDSTV